MFHGHSMCILDLLIALYLAGYVAAMWLGFAAKPARRTRIRLGATFAIMSAVLFTPYMAPAADQKGLWLALTWASFGIALLGAVGLMVLPEKVGREMDPQLLKPRGTGRERSIFLALRILGFIIMMAGILVGTAHWSFTGGVILMLGGMGLLFGSSFVGYAYYSRKYGPGREHRDA